VVDETCDHTIQRYFIFFYSLNTDMRSGEGAIPPAPSRRKVKFNVISSGRVAKKQFGTIPFPQPFHKASLFKTVAWRDERGSVNFCGKS
jgi:hypothetical protein